MIQQKLIYYSAHAQELVGSTDHKIKAILAQGCLEYIRATEDESSHYVCKPIMQPNGKPYNITTYKLKPNDKECGGHTSCTCQGYQVKLKKWHADPHAPRPSCSHVSALHEYWKRGHMVRQGMHTVFGRACNSTSCSALKNLQRRIGFCWHSATAKPSYTTTAKPCYATAAKPSYMAHP